MSSITQQSQIISLNQPTALRLSSNNLPQDPEDKELVLIEQRAKIATFTSVAVGSSLKTKTVSPFRPLHPIPSITSPKTISDALIVSDVLRVVLSFLNAKTDLPHTALVNKSWRTQSNNACIDQLKEKATIWKKCPTFNELECYQKALQLSDLESVFGLLWEDCQSIEILDLSQSGDIRDPQLAQFMTLVKQFCPNLSKIDLSGCSFCTNELLINIFEGFQNLTSVNISRCSQVNDSVVTAIADNCPHLKTAIFSKCPLITDTSVAILAAKCPDLENLDISGCSRLTDHTLTAFSSHISHFKTLSLVHCEGMSDHSMRSFVLKSRDLRELSISCVVTDEFVEGLVKVCPQITHIAFLNGNDLLTDRGIQLLFLSYPNLIHLNLSHHNKLTDAGILGLKLKNRLSFFDLSHCYKLSDKSIVHLSKTCPNITKLNLEHCHGVTRNGVSALVENRLLQDVGTSIQQNWFVQIKNPSQRKMPPR